MDTAKEIARLKKLNEIQIVVKAQNVSAQLLDAMAQVAALRRSAVRSLRAQGWTFREIAEASDMTPQRVAQIEKGFSPRLKKD